MVDVLSYVNLKVVEPSKPNQIRYDTQCPVYISTVYNHYFSQITSANEFFWITLDWYTPKGISNNEKKVNALSQLVGMQLEI